MGSQRSEDECRLCGVTLKSGQVIAEAGDLGEVPKEVVGKLITRLECPACEAHFCDSNDHRKALKWGWWSGYEKARCAICGHRSGLEYQAILPDDAEVDDLGPEIRKPLIVASSVYRYIGDEFEPKTGDEFGYNIDRICEYENHIMLWIRVAMVHTVFLVIPKRDVIRWGVMRVADLPGYSKSHTGLVVGALMFGPIGAWVGSREDEKSADYLVTGITYRRDDAENALFIQCPYGIRKLYDFLNEALPIEASAELS